MSQDKIPTVGHIWTAGDQQPTIGVVIKKKDTTGFTVNLQLKQPDGTIITKVGTPVTLSAEFSQYTFAWASSDLVEGNKQLCEIELVNGSAETETSRKFYITVREDLG